MWCLVRMLLSSHMSSPSPCSVPPAQEYQPITRIGMISCSAVDSMDSEHMSVERYDSRCAFLERFLLAVRPRYHTLTQIAAPGCPSYGRLTDRPFLALGVRYSTALGRPHTTRSRRVRSRIHRYVT